MVRIISDTDSIFSQYLAEIRDVEVQKDALRFRRNMERISEIMAYEISKTLHFKEKSIKTPLANATQKVLSQAPVIGSILRAGLSMHNGFLNRFDKAENAFISAYREKTDDNSIKVKIEYMASPVLTGKTLIIVDPMLATGKSMTLAYESLLTNGTPKRVIIAAAIASQQAMDAITAYFSSDIDIWIGAIDPELNDKSYIVPGIGDAGDLAYGPKIDQ